MGMKKRNRYKKKDKKTNTAKKIEYEKWKFLTENGSRIIRRKSWICKG